MLLSDMEELALSGPGMESSKSLALAAACPLGVLLMGTFFLLGFPGDSLLSLNGEDFEFEPPELKHLTLP
jgi:hypothetical protein